jgi:hypothetical protein
MEVMVISTDNSFESFKTTLNVSCWSDCMSVYSRVWLTSKLPVGTNENYTIFKCLIKTIDVWKDPGVFNWYATEEAEKPSNIILGGENNTLSTDTTLMLGSNLKNTN